MMNNQILRFVLLSLSPLLLCTPAVVYAQWGPDVRLTYNDSVSQTCSNNGWSVAATPEGNVHVVWYDSRDGNPEIYYKRSTDWGVGWSPDTRLTFNSQASRFPSVSVSGSTVHVIWYDTRDGNWEIYYKCSTDAGNSWGTDVRLTNDTSRSFQPSLSSSNSRVYAVWADGRDGNFEIYFKRSTDNGSTWSSDMRLTNAPNTSWLPSIASSDTNVHIVWNDRRDGNIEVYYKRSSDAGMNWSPDLRLTNDSLASTAPSVAVSGSVVHVVWGYDPTNNVSWRIFYRRSSDGGISWSPPSRLTGDSGFANSPSLSASGRNVHLIWRGGVNPYGNVIGYNHSTDEGISWSPDTLLAGDTSLTLDPSVSASGPAVHAIWWSDRVGNREIFYKRNPTGNSGVEGSTPSAPISHFPFSICPNPFTSFATVPGHISDRFALYDISGRRVETFRGDRIGEGLALGVYFIKQEDRDSKPLRIVKVR